MIGTNQNRNIVSFSAISIILSGCFMGTPVEETVTNTAPDTNAAPTISGIPMTSTVAGESYAFTPVAADADGDALSFTIAGKPNWLGFDSATGSLTGTPSFADIGMHRGISISVSDGEFTVSLTPFSIAVSGVATNSPPTISGSPPTAVATNSEYTFVPIASDPDGDSLSFSIIGLPSWGAFDGTTGGIRGTPNDGDVGTYGNISISVSDGSASATLPSFSVTVIDPGNAQVYYVAPISTECNPSSKGSGTLSDPWTSLFYALRSGGLVAGDKLQLRAGTYRIAVNGFSSPDCIFTGGIGGDYAVADVTLAGTVGNEIIIENYPGEVAIVDGTDADMDTVTWTNCSGFVWNTTAFNVGSARTPRIWVNPVSVSDPGTRMKWNSDAGNCPALGAGEYSVASGGRLVAIRMPDNSDPNAADLRMSCQAGDCATHGIHVGGGAQYVTFRKNPSGGRFTVKYGYYSGYIAGNAHHITFDGLDWIAAGGRDYGQCVRTSNGDFVTVKNGTCRDAVAEGIAHYGGGPEFGIQLNGNVVDNMDIYDTGRGWVDGGGNGTSLGQSVILKNCQDCVVRNSRLRNGYRTGIQVNQSTTCGGAQCRGDNVLIENNEIWDVCRFRAGTDPNSGQTDCGFIMLNTVAGVINGGTIRNNMIYGNLSAPFSNNAAPSGIYTDGDIPNVEIVNNSLNDIPGACINVQPNQRQVTIIGNAMNNCSTSGGGCNGGVCNLYTDASTQHDTRYNTYWAQTASTQVIRRRGSAGYMRDQVVSAWEPTAVQVNPDFMSETDLRISSTSGLIDVEPCNDAPPVDINEMPRPQGAACDVGAYEQ